MTSGGVINANTPIWFGEQRVPGSSGGGGGFPPGIASTVPYYDGTNTASLANLGSTTATTLLRILTGTVYGRLANVVTDFGATPNVDVDQSAHFQAAYDAVEANDFVGMFLPDGDFSIVAGVINTATVQGMMTLGLGGAIDTNTAATRGTILQARTGGSGKYLVNIDGTAGFLFANFSVYGNTSATLTGASNGIRLQNRVGSGFGAGSGILSQVSMQWCAVGFNAGSIDGGDSDHDMNNSADLTFDRCTFWECATGFQTIQDQNINYLFSGCSWVSSASSAVAIDCVKGGNLKIDMPATSNIRTFIQVTGGGLSGTIHVAGGHIDGDGTVRTQLYTALAASSPSIAVFDAVGINPDTLTVVSGGPCVTVKAGHQVTLRNMSNLGSANGAIFKIDGGGRVVLINCAIPATLAYVLDATSSLGTTGSYAVLNCTDEATGLPIQNYGTGITPVRDEVPTGTINSSNVTFTLANAPNPANSLVLFKNGLKQTATADYSLSSLTITYTTAPATSSTHQAFYTY